MVNFRDAIMYIRYYKKTVYLKFLKRYKGLDYTGRIENTDRSLCGYEGCYPVKPVLNKLNITGEDSILDIGCGKGLFLYYATKFDFCKIDGLEYSPFIVKYAEQNAKLLRDNRIKVYSCDARLFTKFDEYNFFFINNPFNAEITEQIAVKLRDSCIKKDNRIIVIYQFPFHLNVFEKYGFRILYKKYPNVVLTFG